METVSKDYLALKELAEVKNPYDKVCPNRHLWEEGFVSGAVYERQKWAFWENLKQLLIKEIKKIE
jgi:hypothetical protein